MMNERAYELGCTDTHFCKSARSARRRTLYDCPRPRSHHAAALKSDNFRTITNTAVYELPQRISPARELKNDQSADRRLDQQQQLLQPRHRHQDRVHLKGGPLRHFLREGRRHVLPRRRLRRCHDGARYRRRGWRASRSASVCSITGFDQFSYVSIVSPLYPPGADHGEQPAASQVVSWPRRRRSAYCFRRTTTRSSFLLSRFLSRRASTRRSIPVRCSAASRSAYDGETLGTTDLLAINDVAKSDFNATVSGASSYIQKNWWKWVVFVIVLMLAGGVVFLIYLQLRKRQERQARMERRRKALEHRRRQQEDEPYGYYDDPHE